MQKLNFAIFLSLLILPALIYSQDQSGHFLVEFEKFSPPTKDIIRHYEGFPAEGFMASDMNKKNVYLGDFKGKVCLLTFWSVKSPDASRNLEMLNNLQEKYRNSSFSVVSFADESRSETESFLANQGYNFIIMPNGAFFGEAAYAKDLGNPRAFLIDKSGVIMKVFPGEFFLQANTEAQSAIEKYVERYINK
jgi:peroxiredoxin